MNYQALNAMRAALEHRRETKDIVVQAAFLNEAKDWALLAIAEALASIASDRGIFVEVKQ